ncbi:MAG: response regulator [Defluviitaleaceae bacterium]|nr:response regulator [Defluviitaleaceae bacterium]
MYKPEIAVVDDQPAICKEVASFLKSDYTVHAFKSGKDALTYFEKNHVDFILLDYYMPEMTGFEVLLQIRQSKAIADIPVVFLTAEVNDRMEHEMKQRGATDYIRKPINAAKLRACITKYLVVNKDN